MAGSIELDKRSLSSGHGQERETSIVWRDLSSGHGQERETSIVWRDGTI